MSVIKKLLVLTILIVGGLVLNAQNKPLAKAPVKKQVVEATPKAACKAAKSCCKNEKALSALRRPTAKPVSTVKKSK